MAACSTSLRNSRTFPNQGCNCRKRKVAVCNGNDLGSKRCKKCSARTSISSVLSRSGGNATPNDTDNFPPPGAPVLTTAVLSDIEAFSNFMRLLAPPAPAPATTSTTHGSAPLLLMIDDGWGAAGSWDARIRTAEDLIARADADGRGVAVLPLSNTNRDISLETAGAAKARLRLIKPKPQTVERTEAPDLTSVALIASSDRPGGTDTSSAAPSSARSGSATTSASGDTARAAAALLST